MEYNYTIHYQICDNVLKNLQQGNDMHEVNIEPLLSEDRRAKLAIVRKLDKDGYVHRVHPTTHPFEISITVEGIQFLADGGYKQHFQELKQKSKLENRLLKINIRTNIFSALVGLSVIVSAIYQFKSYSLETKKQELLREEKSQNSITTKELLKRIENLEKSTLKKNKAQDIVGLNKN